MKDFIASRYPDLNSMWLPIMIAGLSVSMGRNLVFGYPHFGVWSLMIWVSLFGSIATGRKDVLYGVLILYYPLFHLPFVEFGGGNVVAYACGALWALLFSIAMASNPKALRGALNL